MYIIFLFFASLVYLGSLVMIGGFPFWYKQFFQNKKELYYLPFFLVLISGLYWLQSGSSVLLLGFSPHILACLVCGHMVDKQVQVEYEQSVNRYSEPFKQ